jgi:hypothetical protein
MLRTTVKEVALLHHAFIQLIINISPSRRSRNCKSSATAIYAYSKMDEQTTHLVVHWRQRLCFGLHAASIEECLTLSTVPACVKVRL